MNEKVNFHTIYSSLKDQIIKEELMAGYLLPTELELAKKYAVSRPTIAKVYNKLQEKKYVLKRKGLGTIITYNNPDTILTFGLLLSGAGESEIFSIINDQILKQSESGKFNCLWDGATANSADIRKSLIETCCDTYIQKKVDGVLFSPLERLHDAEELNLLVCNKITAAEIPIVLIDRDIVRFPIRSGFDLVSIDNFKAGYIMSEHLADAGCEHVHFLYRPDSAGSVNLRLSGVQEVAFKRRLVFNETNIYCGNPDDLNFVKQIKIVKGKTGILCANDSTAAVLMSSLDALGIKISSDVLVCGYDDMKYAQHLKHSLTSFRQPCEEIADISIELMI
ncbi:MAG: GntR family transcriptional regulator, partial [Tannerella sp.]|nr:GntR family transcriptional regulator [Tannerella sp.]